MVDQIKNSLVDPEKIYFDEEKTAWLIQKKLHDISRKITASIQIQLGTMQSPTLPYLPLPSHFTRASEIAYRISPPPHPHPRCVSIKYHMLRPSYMRVLR